MGKGTIISEYGAGKYLVSINYDRERLDALLASIDAQIATLSADIAELTSAEDVARAALSTAGADLDIAIIFYTSDPNKTNKRAVETATTRKNSAVNTYDDALAATAGARLKRQSLESRSANLLTAIPEDDPEVDAWCADFNEGLTGEVGLIEVGRTTGEATITPAGAVGTEAEYIRTADGSLMPMLIMSPPAAYYNNAMLAATNKWKPRYRRGEILTTDRETCTVSLDPENSTSQNLNINQTDTVTAGFEYMNCNGAVFVAGDRVIVAFTGEKWDEPVVIGFDKEPKPCFRGFAFATQVAANEIRTAQYMSGDPPWAVTEYTFGGRPLYGNIDWRGEDGEILSFKGYNRYMGFVSKYPEVLDNSNRLDIYIYKDGKVLLALDDSRDRVSGVCISGSKLFYVAYNHDDGDKFYFADLDDLSSPRLVHTEPPFYQGDFPIGPWLIDAQGRNGTTRRLSSDGVQINRYHLSIDPSAETVHVSDKGQNDQTSGAATSWNYSKMAIEDFDGNRLVKGSLEIVGTVETSGVDAYNEMMEGMAYLGIEPAIGSSGSMSVDHKSRTVIIMDGQVLVDEILYQDKYSKSWVVVEYPDIPGYDWLCEFSKDEAPRIFSMQVIKWMDMRGPFLAFDAYTETWDAQAYEYALSDSKYSGTGGIVSQDSSTYAKSVIVSPAYSRNENTFVLSKTFNVDRYTNWLDTYQYPTKYNESDISQYPTAHGEPPIVYAELVPRQVVVYEKYGNAAWYRDDKTKTSFSFIKARQMPTGVSNRQMYDSAVQSPDSPYEFDEYITDADLFDLVPIKGKSHFGAI